MQLSGSFTLFRIRAIPIRAHWSLLLALVYATVAFSGNFEKMTYLAGVPKEQLALSSYLWGALIAVGLFASVALHELAHSLFAVRAGGKVREITLMIVGGVSQMEKMPERLSLEGWMAFVGPLSSLGIAGLLALAHGLVPIGGHLADLRLGLFYLAGLNLSLGLFNLLPAFPMDGGRILRAALGARLGRLRATRVASVVGQIMAVAFGIAGFLAPNLLLIIIALFLFSAARAEEGMEERRAAQDPWLSPTLGHGGSP